MKFVDEIKIRVRAGHGGAGSVSFIREKFREFGGPDGGDGGRGGNVRIRSHSSLQTLGNLLKAHLYCAPNGDPGRARQMTGANGKDLILNVPVGTEVFNAETGDKLCDLDRYDTDFAVAYGGIGGLGNQHFATSVNQVPTHAQPGKPGEELELKLRLKLLADAGLVGLPNAGKSTLISAITRNQARVADYAFTTLTPNLGIVESQDELRRLILADIPGIIEGASKGHGLGLAFLRHIERVRVIVYVIDGANLEPLEEVKLLQAELLAYSPQLLSRPALIVINKIDQMDYDLEFAEESIAKLKSPELWTETSGHIPRIIFMSAKEQHATDEFVDVLFAHFPEPTLAEAVLIKQDDEAASRKADAIAQRNAEKRSAGTTDAGEFEETERGLFTHRTPDANAPAARRPPGHDSDNADENDLDEADDDDSEANWEIITDNSGGVDP